MKKSQCAFTLIELLVVIVVIAILATIGFPVFTSVQERARAVEDLNNLRQIGIATQTYLNDHDSVIFLTDQAASPWTKSLCPKYLSAWKIFQSPFDRRASLEDAANSPVSYGVNTNAIGIQTDKIQKPSLFILFAPAQTNGTQVAFSGLAGATVKVVRDTSTPGGSPPEGGTHNSRTRINALFADLHSESLTWTTFIADAAGAADDPSRFRWEP